MIWTVSVDITRIIDYGPRRARVAEHWYCTHIPFRQDRVSILAMRRCVDQLYLRAFFLTGDVAVNRFGRS